MAIQSVWTSKMVRASFKRAGVVPCDFEQVLSQFNFRLSPDKRKNIEEKLPEMIKRMKTQGELYDVDFDEFGISRSEHKSKYVISRRRTIILTHSMVIEKEKQKRLQSERRRALGGKENISPNEDDYIYDSDDEVQVTLLKGVPYVTPKPISGVKNSLPAQSGEQILQSVKRSKKERMICN